MPYIKKLVMQGFKSFPTKTEIVFDKGINSIVGPNGSGKSNIADSLCFVLGRLNIKSIRAAKASELLFMGTKARKPSSEAIVELIFDNADRAFTIQQDEVSIKRIVRRNGQSAYKINNEIKTRQEILELLAQAGIDPHGFNIILQGEIDSIIKMRAEEKRQIIEEVAGISVYESRKEKSLHELEKTEERLKEINTVLRERTAYLKNLEEERQQALKFKHLKETIKRCKASIIYKNIEEKEKEKKHIEEEIEKKQKQKQFVRDEIEKINVSINETEKRISEINAKIHTSTGVEQERLNEEVTNLKAELAGLAVRKDNFELRLIEIKKRRAELEKNLKSYDFEISELKKKSPNTKKQDDLKRKKQELESLEEQRRRFYSMKNEIFIIKDRISEKEKISEKISEESGNIVKNIEQLSANLHFQSLEKCRENIKNLRKDMELFSNAVNDFEEKNLKFQKELSVTEAEISKNERLRSDIGKIEVCPLCKSKITEEHITHVISEAERKIKEYNLRFKQLSGDISEINSEKKQTKEKIIELQKNIKSAESELLNLYHIQEKKEQLRKILDNKNILKSELNQLSIRKRNIEKNIVDLNSVEEKYDSLILEIEEISARTEKDVDTTILYKEREAESTRNIIKRSHKDEQEIIMDLKEISEQIKNKDSILEDREKAAEMLSDRFKQFLSEREKLQEEIRKNNLMILEKRNISDNTDNSLNNLKIEKARIDAEHENLDIEFKEFKDIEVIKASKQVLQEKLEKSEEDLERIGSVNLKALEVYDSIKQEYDAVSEKANKLLKEKEEILKIVEEIDKKKKKTFMKTLDAINELFVRNYLQLSAKGKAFLELENKEDIFAGGLNITIKIGQGKYFDAASLSGGEKVLVALSLLFAIQEYKPYCFYIFDEIDAALDKRNSERLTLLLKRYMHIGQYIIVTHNDALITGSNLLYGVSMQDGISKIVGLKI